VGFTEVGETRQLPVVGIFGADRLFASDVILPISLVERYFPLSVLGIANTLAAVTVQRAGTATVVLPARQLLVDLVLAGAAGLLAAAVPARRAGRLDPLTAIGTQ
jgi:putative ABC transport system permease protein